MLIEGHYEVLEDMARSAPGAYDGWPLMRARGQFLRALRVGVAYPDMPCGRERVSRRTGRVRVSRLRLCGHLKLLKGLLLRRSVGVRLLTWLASPLLPQRSHSRSHSRSRGGVEMGERAYADARSRGERDDPYQLHELYQSHLGSQAHLHAMSPGLGDATVGDVTYRIVRQMLVLTQRAAACALAGDAAYPHWVGIMLHVLTDSYTPGHVVRIPNQPFILGARAGQARPQTPSKSLTKMTRVVDGCGGWSPS